MRRRIYFIFFIITGLVILVDLYFSNRVTQYIFQDNQLFLYIFWGVSAIFLISLSYVLWKSPWKSANHRTVTSTYRLMGFFVLLYFPKILAGGFFLANDLFRLIVRLISDKIYVPYFFYLGLGVGLIAFVLVLYGIFFGKYHFKIEKLTLPFHSLPRYWSGLRIVHFSDMHIGSWTGNPAKVKKAVKLINSCNPDLIVFTGDLINNFAEEVEEFLPLLKKMEARIGKYSILGNHDYGDYFNWPSEQAKKENMQKLIDIQREMGFELLLNDSEIIEKDGSSIGIIGVENWGLPPFHQNGDLEKALRTLKQSTDFNILLSHDPSHWKEKVIKRDDIQLTLSGHTHGMQFGIYTKNFKWSPAKWKYQEWGGLYSNNGQKLYVSNGLGFIGFPGRIGIRPRITQITLKSE